MTPSLRLRTLLRVRGRFVLLAGALLAPTLTWAAAASAQSASARSSSALPADGGLAVLEAAAARYAEVRGLCGDFVQELANPLLGETRTSRGRLCQLRPNLFRMDFTDPAGDLVLADGRHFHLYYPSLNPGQVLRLPLDPERGGLDFFREFVASPGDKYEVTQEGTETIAGRQTVRLLLRPRMDRGIREARVWVDGASRTVPRIEVVETNGVRRRVTLSGLTLDPDIDAGDFTFTLPAGARIVDAPGVGGAQR